MLGIKVISAQICFSSVLCYSHTWSRLSVSPTTNWVPKVHSSNENVPDGKAFRFKNIFKTKFCFQFWILAYAIVAQNRTHKRTHKRFFKNHVHRNFYPSGYEGHFWLLFFDFLLRIGVVQLGADVISEFVIVVRVHSEEKKTRLAVDQSAKN